MSNEECRLPLAYCHIHTLQFAEFDYIICQLPNSDLDCPAISLYMSFNPSIDHIKGKGIYP